MDTITIIKLLKTFKCFQGVYPLDKIRPCKKRPRALIINTDKSNEPGEHWVSIIIDNNGCGEYFDSFGLPPLHVELIKYLDKNCTNGWRFNPIALQSDQSTTCGHYCVLYVMFRCLGYTYDEYMAKFRPNKRDNDATVAKIFGHYTL
jgi:hypothetical protein